MAEHGIPALAAIIVERCGSSVLSGPFAGMDYITESAGSAFLPKLIGSYECELHSIIEKILTSNYDTVADIGSAEGYYAVGLAMHLPKTSKIYAFDINPDAQKLCASLAKKNHVEEKVIILGHCDAEYLQKTLKGYSLVICDCEGYETELLQPLAAPVLYKADILVELHDCLKPGITSTIINRFKSSHDILIIDSIERKPNDYLSIGFLMPQQQVLAVSEFRHGHQQWAFMTPK